MMHQQHRKLLGTHSAVTIGNQLRLEKARCKYDLRKYCYTNRTVNISNSLPNHCTCWIY